mmetsp:Transcript_43522/g.110216  ORF Transcript_43522/g.110216 Transcript_43522/m.110216 type:complete len:90 (+) Transcript_43522:913-1182(+)
MDVKLPQELGERSTVGRRQTELKVSATYTRASRLPAGMQPAAALALRRQSGGHEALRRRSRPGLATPAAAAVRGLAPSASLSNSSETST